MFFTTSSRRGLSLAVPAFWTSCQSCSWQAAQSTLASGAAESLACALPLAALSLMSEWQATHVILACTLCPNLSAATDIRARGLPSLPGASNLSFLPSWQLRQVALSSDTAAGTGAAAVADIAGSARPMPSAKIRRLNHREVMLDMVQDPKLKKEKGTSRSAMALSLWDQPDNTIAPKSSRPDFYAQRHLWCQPPCGRFPCRRRF